MITRGAFTRRRFSAFVFVIFALFNSCVYHIESVRTGEASLTSSRDIAIGYFETTGRGSENARRNFYDALEFSLREKNFKPAESNEVSQLFDRSELPKDRILNSNELVRLSGQYPGRLFVQGVIDEVRTERLLEDQIQVMVNVSAYEMRQGKKLFEIKVFAKDLEFRTGKESLDMARLVVKEMDKILTEGK